MPDAFFSQEHVETTFGMFNQPTVPASLPKRFFSLLHNVALVRGMPHTRPGIKRINGAALGNGSRTVYGLSVWRADPDELIVACGSLLQSMPANGGDPTTITESFPTSYRTSPTGAKTEFAQLGSRLFIVNGVDANVKYNGTNLTRMGLVAPSTLSAPSKSSGAINGTRKYKATLVSSAVNGSVESEGTTALEVSYTAQQGSFTAPSVPSSDPQVDRWNLYRTAAGGNTYYRVNTSPVTLATAIADNLSDAVLDAGTTMDAELTNSVPPGIFKHLISHQGRLVGVTAEEPNTLYWSDIGFDIGGIYPKPESWPPRNRLVFGENGGTVITAIVSFFSWIVIFQNFGTWSIEGDINSDAKQIQPLLVAPDNRGIGVSDSGNIAHAENKILFAAKDNIYQIVREFGAVKSDLAVQPLSLNIDSLYQKIDFSSGGVSAYDRDRHRWMFWGKGKATT